MAFIPTTSLSSLAINKCVASTLRIGTALPFTLFAVPINQETTDHAFPALRVKGHGLFTGGAFSAVHRVRKQFYQLIGKTGYGQ